MALLPEHVEETHRAALELGIFNAELGQSLLDEAGKFSDLADTRKVAFHIRHEAGHARLAECLRYDLEGDGFTGAGCTSYESVAVGHLADHADRSVFAVGNVEPSFFIEHFYRN